MSMTPRRIKVNGEWYDARQGWCQLELTNGLTATTKYTAKTEYAHLSNLYFVYNDCGNKVGEFDINNRAYSGSVSDFEM